MAVPLINGIAHSWATINVVVLGQQLQGITSVEYNKKQNIVDNYGAGQYPVSRGYGNFEFDGAIEMYKDELDKLVAISPNRNPLELPFFDIVIVYAGVGIAPTRTTLKACNFMELPVAVAQGDTNIKVKIPLKIADIVNK
jgi:hypothetical protein